MRAAIARFGGIGDNLITSSVLPLLQAKYDEVDVLARKPYHDVFDNNPHISRLILPDVERIPADQILWQQWFDSRAMEYDFFVNLSHSYETFLVTMAGQTQFYWPQEFRRKYYGRSILEITHDICGVDHEFAPNFFPTEGEYDLAMATKAVIGGDYIAWCISGSRIDKIYVNAPAAVARIVREIGQVVFFGTGEKDFLMAKAIEDHVKDVLGSNKGLHFAMSPDPKNPSWPMRRAMTQIQQSRVVVGPDTGLMWACAMHDMPKIMLLSHSSQENVTKHWYKTLSLHADPKRVPCWPCHRLHEDIKTCKPNKTNNGAACITDISVETLVQAIGDAYNSV